MGAGHAAAARRPVGPAAYGLLAAGSRAGDGAGERAGQVEPVVVRGRSPSGGRRPQVVTAHLPVRHLEAHAGQLLGYVGRDGRGDQHLLGAGHQLRELRAALGVELGEDVVEDQDRVVAVGPHQVVRRQPQRERERPGLAVARRSPAPGSRCSPLPSDKHQLVAVGTDQRDPAVELVVATDLELREEPGRSGRRGRWCPRASRLGW